MHYLLRGEHHREAVVTPIYLGEEKMTTTKAYSKKDVQHLCKYFEPLEARLKHQANKSKRNLLQMHYLLRLGHQKEVIVTAGHLEEGKMTTKACSKSKDQCLRKHFEPKVAKQKQ